VPTVQEILEFARDGGDDIGLIVRHPVMESLPDTTVLAILGDLRELCKDIQMEEFQQIVSEWALERPDDDVLDEVDSLLAELPTFYIERIERGSLLAALLFALPVLYWIVEHTVGESIEKAYEGSRLDLWVQKLMKRGTVTGALPVSVRHYVDYVRPRRLPLLFVEMVKNRGHIGGFPVDDVRANDQNITVILGAGDARVVRLGRLRLNATLGREFATR
jgi:hypothetical protein